MYNTKNKCIIQNTWPKKMYRYIRRGEIMYNTYLEAPCGAISAWPIPIVGCPPVRENMTSAWRAHACLFEFLFFMVMCLPYQPTSFRMRDRRNLTQNTECGFMNICKSCSLLGNDFLRCWSGYTLFLDFGW